MRNESGLGAFTKRHLNTSEGPTWRATTHVWRSAARWGRTVFAHESSTRSVRFDAENRLYWFALTVPLGLLAPSLGLASLGLRPDRARSSSIIGDEGEGRF
jgi:hypothetical protein